ncbi:MAG: glycosyltransferase family 4 protein [Tannerellaceae bacterium]
MCWKGYLFIANSPKLSDSDHESIESVPVGSFRESSLFAARELGYKLFCGIARYYPERIKCSTLGYDVIFYNDNIFRNVLAFKDNWIAYKNACRFLERYPEIEVIHCNTPIGGVIGRLVGYKYKKKVIYTAHGFHFYEGAPLLNWILFYPVEKILSKWTDVLITINSEDYNLARAKFKLRNNGKVYYVPGVGVDTSKFQNVENIESGIRQEIGLDENSIIVVAVGRLDVNKNIATLIKAFADIKSYNTHLVICGEGDQRDKLETLIKDNKLQDRVHLIGNRSDISTIYNASDIFVLASYREGLSRSIMEGMASGLPCVVSKIRGNVDLIDENGGFVVSPFKPEEFTNAIDKLANNTILRKKMGDYNRIKVGKFSLTSSKEAFLNIFKRELK